jgi:XRE family transcriptional regulator, regulator of sulfur utilization
VPADPLAQRFAQNLEFYFSASGLSQEALAAKAEIHRTQVSELLRGRGNPTLSTIVRIAGALGCQPADLVAGMNFEPADAQGKFKIKPSKR